MNIYMVNWANPLSGRDYSEIFINKEEALKIFKEKLDDSALGEVKIAKVPDIWNFTAKNFSEKIREVMFARMGEDGNFSLEKDGITFPEELNELAKAAGLEDFDCEFECMFESPAYDVYVLSCAWTYGEELHHFIEKLEVF